MHFSPINIRDDVSRWAGSALAQPEFGISFEPIPTMGGGAGIPTTLLIAPPTGFENPMTSLNMSGNINDVGEIEKFQVGDITILGPLWH